MTIDPGGIATGEGIGSPRPKGCIRSWKPWTWRTIRSQLVGPGNIPSGEVFGTPELQSIVRQILAAGNISSLQAVGTPIIHASIEIWAASPALADVQAAIAEAAEGDTVRIPAGSATWASQLYINKGIYLVGAGIGSTNIKSGFTPAAKYDYRCALIAYIPSSPALNGAFDLSGISYDLDKKTNWIWLGNSSLSPLTKIRLHHNYITKPAVRQILVRGTIYGVADHNTMIGGYNVISAYGYDGTAWTNLTFSFGDANTFFLEDNTISCDDGVTESADAGRYCFRHNTVTVINGTAGWPICDAHGNMGTGNEHSTMGMEIYENAINAGGYAIRLFDHRGGMGLVFNNAISNGSADSQTREEHNDNLNAPAVGPGGQPQYVSSSYYWNNKYGSTLIVPTIPQTIDYGGTIGVVPRWNVNCWNEEASFDGSSGVGVGLKSARPASGLTVGVGYWATDENKLYRAIGPSSWELYYQPYTYPHPLAI